MHEPSGETSRLVHSLAGGDGGDAPPPGVDGGLGGGWPEFDALIRHTMHRLKKMAAQMFAGYPCLAGIIGADDVLQEALILLLREVRDNPPDSARDYYRKAGQIVRRVLIALKRKHCRSPRAAFVEPPDDGTSFSSLEDWARFHLAIERLPDELREVFELTYYEGLSRKQAARVLFVSERTIKRLYRAALIELSRLLNR